MISVLCSLLVCVMAQFTAYFGKQSTNTWRNKSAMGEGGGKERLTDR